jgi:hypothetical protein
VYSIAQDKRHIFGEWFYTSNKKSDVANLRLVLGAKSIEVGMEKIRNEDIKVADVLVGPFDL